MNMECEVICYMTKYADLIVTTLGTQLKWKFLFDELTRFVKFEVIENKGWSLRPVVVNHWLEDPLNQRLMWVCNGW